MYAIRSYYVSSRSEINQILKDYPEVIHQRAKQAAQDHYYLLVSIDELDQAAKTAVNTLLSQYSPESRKAFEQNEKYRNGCSTLKTHRISTTISQKHWELLKKHTEKFETQQKVLEHALESLENSSKQNPELTREERA